MTSDAHGGGRDEPSNETLDSPCIEFGTGQPLYPQILRHLYTPNALNEPIALYRGQYCLPPSDCDELAYHGTIELKWLPHPQIEACGERTLELRDRFRAELARRAQQPGTAWVIIPGVRLPGVPGVPPKPAQAAVNTAPASGIGEQLTTMVFPSEFGDGSALSRVTGLVVNGFDAGDGSPVMDPRGLRWPVSARTIGKGGGWVVTVDSLTLSDADWKELERNHGYQATHVVELAREDGACFTADQADTALEVIGYGLTIALGRHVCVMLPVGWQQEEAVWTRWRFRRIDPHSGSGTWLDHMVASTQVGELLGRMLEIWQDDLRRETLRDASSYLVQAQAGQAELGITLPISGLTLLSYSHLVEELGTHSKAQWDKLWVEGQIRELITSLRSAANLEVPADQVYLEALRARLAAKSSKAVFDGLSCIVKMRNAIMHPSRGERSDWTYEEIVEGYLLATHLFEMALLAYVGYRGKVHPRISAVRMAGYIEDVPWATA
ncbi:hypothetical protein [Actinospica robiniae]|uniref:hypothetical protein n=1 Tax=Actinospica robiniae TaxID=304901 RepID=UPI00040F3747|nr:hypothetical protein [Actinospica robiniae]